MSGKKQNGKFRRGETKTPGVPDISVREKHAKTFRRAKVFVNKLSGIDRLNAIPDYTKTMNPDIIARTYASYGSCNVDELNAAQLDKNNTIIEVGIIRQLIEMIKNSDNKTMEYFHSRIEGKPKDRIEHSGPLGGPIETRDVVMDFDLKKMSRDQRLKLKKHLLAIQKVPVKIKDEEED